LSRKASPEAHVQKTVIEGTVLDAQGKSVDAYVTVAPKTSLLRGMRGGPPLGLLP